MKRAKSQLCIIIEARAVYHRTGDGTLVLAQHEDTSSERLEPPDSIQDLRQDIVKSGAVILPGMFYFFIISLETLT